MMTDRTDDFFIPDNEIRLPEELDYSRVNEYIRSAEAFSRSSYQSVYIIDYFRQNFLYVSPNPMFLCGMSPEQMKELGYRFYLGYVPEDEQPMLLTLNKAGFAFFNDIYRSMSVRTGISPTISTFSTRERKSLSTTS